MLGKPQQEPGPTSWRGAWGLSVRDGVLGAKGSSMQKTPGAQSGWERGAPGQEQVRVSPKQGGSLTSPAVSSSSTSPMMNGPSHTCRLSQWDSRGETSWWRSWQGLCEAATHSHLHPRVPSPAEFHTQFSLHQRLAQSLEAHLQQTKQWPGQAPGCAALLGLPCRGSAGHLSTACPPTPQRGCCLVQGQKWGDSHSLSPFSLPLRAGVSTSLGC